MVCTSPSRQRFSERRTASAARRRGGSAPTAWLGLGFRVRFRVRASVRVTVRVRVRDGDRVGVDTSSRASAPAEVA